MVPQYKNDLYMDDSPIIVHIWIPPGILATGHSALYVDNETYISFYPKGTRGEKVGKKGWATNRDWTYSDNYQEDCKYIGKESRFGYRESEWDVKLFKLPKQPIKDLWNKIHELYTRFKYNLLYFNCSTVVALALKESYNSYLKTLNKKDRKAVENYEPKGGYTAQGLHSFKASFLQGIGAWSPESVLDYALYLKSKTEEPLR